MQHAASTSGTAVKPSWLADSSETDDLFEDVWREVTDPGNERGEAITSYYAVTLRECDYSNDPDDYGYAMWRDLIGIEVEGDNGTRYLSRTDLGRAGFNCFEFDGWAA